MLRFTLFLLLILSSFSSAVIATPLENKIIKLATTTSTENSGLLKYLLPQFESVTGYKVHVIAVGTGKALRMGQDGDVDVVLVHALSAENEFVAKGYGDKRYSVMHNDFVIVGPKNDPAQLKQASSINQAFQRLAASQQIFVSRGDNSGTYKKEMSIWQKAKTKPNTTYYREAGQGMGKVLQISGELGAYTLTDRGTWIAYKDKSPLTIVFEKDTGLFNPYGIIAVSKNKHSDINHLGAEQLIKWITSTRGQHLIGSYRLSGQQLFTPSASSDIAIQQ